MLPLSTQERLKRYYQGKETEMACKYAKRTDHGWECTNAKETMQISYSRPELVLGRIQMD